MSKPFFDYFSKMNLSDEDKRNLRSLMDSVNRFTFLLWNIADLTKKAVASNQPKEFQEALHKRWGIITKKHNRSWNRLNKASGNKFF